MSIKSWGERLIIIRKNKKMSQKVFAVEIGFSQQNLSKFEKSLDRIPVVVLQYVVDNGYGLDWFLLDEGQQKTGGGSGLAAQVKENRSALLSLRKWEATEKKRQRIELTDQEALSERLEALEEIVRKLG